MVFLITAVLADEGLNDLVNKLAEAGLLARRAVNILKNGVDLNRQRRVETPELPESLGDDVREAVEGELEGIGAVGRTAGAIRTSNRLKEILSGI